MLIELFGENFGCFRDEFRLSMLATDIDRGLQRGIVEVPIEGDEPLRLLRAAAIYGPNASGKSTVLRAGRALAFLIEESATFRSDQPLFPYTPFMLDPAMRKKPVTLGLSAVVEEMVYEYSVRFTANEVLEETLTHVAPRDDIVLFHRLGREVTGKWKGRKQFDVFADSFRANALLLSLADSLAPSLAGGIATGLTRLLQYYEPTPQRYFWRFDNDPVADRAESDEVFREWLRIRVCDADIGVVDYETEEAPERPRPRGTEQEGASERPKSYRLQLLHEGKSGPQAIPFGHESRGTQQYLSLMPYFFDLAHAKSRHTYLIDEIDASLHPVLLVRMLNHFNCELSQGQVAGQLVFATHTTDVVDDEAKSGVLRRDQIWFTEKDQYGASRLYSLAEFKERGVNNIRRRYLQGRYGAIPSLGDFAEK